VYIHTVRAERPDPQKLKEMMGCVCFALRRTARAVTRFYDAALRPHGLRATQLPILVATSDKESVPLAPLARRLGMDRTTLLRNVRPLARRKLVRVVTAADSRRSEIRATAAGRALLARVYPVWRRTQQQVLQELGSDWPTALDSLSRAARRAPE